MFVIEVDACPLDHPGGRTYDWAVLYRDPHTREKKVFKWGGALSPDKAYMDARYAYRCLLMRQPVDSDLVLGSGLDALDALKGIFRDLGIQANKWLAAEEAAVGIEAKAEARLRADAALDQMSVLEGLYPALRGCTLSPGAMM